MKDIISYSGIKTNNLKNIDLKIKKGSFIGISGPSGSGKSSLAYSTIYAIGHNEWTKVEGSNIIDNQNYRIDSYQNVIPTVAMPQDNFNTNPRSTIGTFLRVDSILRLLFASTHKVSPSIFSFNNPQSACPHCNGLGIERIVNQAALIDWTKSINQKPFLLWKKSYHQALLEKLAVSQGIPLNIPLSQLTQTQLDILLYYKSSEKISVSYVMNGKRRNHKFYYIGYLEDLEALQKDTSHKSSVLKLADYSYSIICSHCRGARLSHNILDLKIRGYSIGDICTMEIEEIYVLIEKWKDEEKDQSIYQLLKRLSDILKGIKDANLGYLSLNRSIPSLSGGEFQRLRLVNILQSQINNVMYIVDEPSARLHVSEYDKVLEDLEKLRVNGNTVLMIEHNPYFLARTDYTLHIGPGAGEKGGYIINPAEYKIEKNLYSKKHIFLETLNFNNISENNLEDVCISIPVEAIIGIYGPSGSGKSTLVKNIARQYDKVEYINQKPLRGSSVSTIASYSGVYEQIRQIFAKESNVDENYFNFNNDLGQCPICKGKGRLVYELDFGKTKIDVKCEDCKGKRYNSEALAFRYKGMNIYDVLNLTIDTLIENKIFEEYPTINKNLRLLNKLGLGYLSLFRTTDTLSGGECQRLKLIKYIGKKLKHKLFIFDEPLRGLSSINALGILSLFQDLVSQGATVIFIEHNTLGFTVSDYIIELGPGKGKNGGKVMFQGSIEDFVKSNNWNQYKNKI